MIKKSLVCAILMLGMCTQLNLHAIRTEEPICITPSFEFKCFIDKFIDNFSVPGMISIVTALLSVYYLHQSLSSYINRETTIINHQRVPELTMIKKAKNYGLASAALTALTAALYFREPLKAALERIPELLKR